MRKRLMLAGAVLAGLIVLGLVLAALVHGHTVSVLQPRGTIGAQERQLMMIATALGLLVVIPVFILTFTIAWRYRADNPRARYSPDWDGNRALELTWWAIPLAIISVLAVITWQSSHQLDPYRPLVSTQPPLTIQVVALDWKWLFIYPDQHIATVNYLKLPTGVPINFEITADAPMNSFWIPQLGSQVYAMPGMSTQLHLLASQVGSYRGSSANISGRGFAGMTFQAEAVAPTDFASWVQSAQTTPHRLTVDTYHQLARPSQNQPLATYAGVQPGLYDGIIMDYMMPMPGSDLALGAAQ